MGLQTLQTGVQTEWTWPRNKHPEVQWGWQTTIQLWEQCGQEDVHLGHFQRVHRSQCNDGSRPSELHVLGWVREGHQVERHLPLPTLHCWQQTVVSLEAGLSQRRQHVPGVRQCRGYLSWVQMCRVQLSSTGVSLCRYYQWRFPHCSGQN